MTNEEPLVYLEIHHYVDSYEPYVGGVTYLHDLNEFKANITNTGFPPSNFSIQEYPNAKMFSICIFLCKRETDLRATRDCEFGFLSLEDLMHFIDVALPERIVPFIGKEPTPTVIAAYKDLCKRYPVLRPMLNYLNQLGDRWELHSDQDTEDD